MIKKSVSLYCLFKKKKKKGGGGGGDCSPYFVIFRTLFSSIAGIQSVFWA